VSLRALELRGHPGREGDCEDAGPVTRRVVEIESRALSSYIGAAKLARMPLSKVGTPVRSLFLLQCGKASENLPVNKERRYGQ